MSVPLAERLRPRSVDDMVGQSHLLSPGAPLRNIILSGTIPNLIFYGPSGTGKTTAAEIIANGAGMYFRKLNGTSASTSDIKAIISEVGTMNAGRGILLYLDEIQYFNKKQQQTLLEYIENGSVTLIASTTENPYFYIYGAVLSRCTVFEFKRIDEKDILKAVLRAFDFLREEKNENFTVEDGAAQHIAFAAGGDARRAVNAAEMCFLATAVPQKGEGRVITLETAKTVTQKTAGRYDRQGDEYYDLLSAFQKSMRGSDPDAAVYYLARILDAGDLFAACRRLMVCACEDVGLAWPMIIPIVKAAVDAAVQVGLPEARIPLADAVVLVANSPKSNSAYMAYGAAEADIAAGRGGAIPRNLQNKHFDGADAAVKGQFYLYPHDFPGHWTPQQYLPDELKSKKYYVPGENKNEQAAKEYWEKIKGGK